MLIYTIIEYTNKGTQGVKSFLDADEANEHFIYLEREFPSCDFEIITSFCASIVTAEDYSDGC